LNPQSRQLGFCKRRIYSSQRSCRGLYFLWGDMGSGPAWKTRAMLWQAQHHRCVILLQMLSQKRWISKQSLNKPPLILILGDCEVMFFLCLGTEQVCEKMVWGGPVYIGKWMLMSCDMCAMWLCGKTGHLPGHESTVSGVHQFLCRKEKFSFLHVANVIRCLVGEVPNGNCQDFEKLKQHFTFESVSHSYWIEQHIILIWNLDTFIL